MRSNWIFIAFDDCHFPNKTEKKEAKQEEAKPKMKEKRKMRFSSSTNKRNFIIVPFSLFPSRQRRFSACAARAPGIKSTCLQRV
jgi:cytoskeletal protein RodZ